MTARHPRAGRARPRLLSLALAVAAAGWWTGAAWGAYSVRIARPAERDVAGNVRIEVVVAGEPEPTDAAFSLVREGGQWDERARTVLQRTEQGAFAAELDTAARPNGVYTLHARAWGPAPPYDPADPATFGAAATVVRIANAPPAPAGVRAKVSGGAVAVSWVAVATADRSDFSGYEVYRAPADGSGCPPFGPAYELQGATAATRLEQGRVEPGGYCYRVRAARTSPTASALRSPPSDPAVARVAALSGSGTFVRFGRAPGSAAPAPPSIPGAAGGVPDGPFSERLPYGSVPGGFAELVEPGAGASSTSEPGPSTRRATSLVATGLVLLVAALHLRRLAAPGPPLSSDGARGGGSARPAR